MEVGETCLLWPYGTIKGYGTVSIEGHNLLVHRISCESWNGPAPEGKPFALHSCNNPRCFRGSHLRWGDDKDNSDDKIASKRGNQGQRHPLARLTEDDVRDIRRLAAKAVLMGLFDRRMADKYGVNPITIYKIRTRRAWKHVE